MTNEAFARIKIDQLLKDTDWRLTDGISVRYEYPLDDGGRADYALFDRQGRALAVLEAKSTSVSLSAGETQGRRYADLLDVPFIFLSNGEEIWFCDKGQDAHFRKIETVFSQDDLARRKAARDIRRSPLDIPIDSRIAGGGGRLYQSACIEAVCREIVNGRRKMLVEMATGTGKTRTAAALLKRLFEANWATRALFVVDRNTLAIQAEDAFAEHLPHLPCYRVPRTGRRFQDEKRVTIVTLQTLVWTEARSSFVYGNFAATILLCQSLVENLLAAFLHTGLIMEDLPPRIAFRDTLKRCQDRNLISAEDSGALERLMSLRNPLSHFRTVADDQNIDRRAITAGLRSDALIEADAWFAVGIAVRVLAKPQFRLG